MILGHISDEARRSLDNGAWLLALMSGISFWQGFALAVTILAGLASFILASIRIYDRLKFGRSSD